MTPAAVPQFIDSYTILSISPSAPGSEVSKAWKQLALLLHPDKNLSRDTKERFQQLQDAYDAIKTARARKHHDALRDQYLAAQEAASIATEAALLAAREAESENARWESDQKQKKQQEMLLREKDICRVQKEKGDKREKAERHISEEEDCTVADIFQILHYGGLKIIQRALYRAKKHWDYQSPVFSEFKNRISASYQARESMHCEARNNIIKTIIQQQQSIHHTRGKKAPLLSDHEELKQNQKLCTRFKALQQESFDYENRQYKWRQSISAEALLIIGPLNQLLEDYSPDCFEPARCFWKSFAEISRPLADDVDQIPMSTSKLWNQALYGFVAQKIGLGVASNLGTEPQDADTIRDIWERKMREGPWYCALGDRLSKPLGAEDRGDICGRCCLQTYCCEHETVASRCENCEMVVCEICRDELGALREFGAWVREAGFYSGERPEFLYAPARR